MSAMSVKASVGTVTAEVAVEGVDIGDHPLRLAPSGVGSEVDVAGGVEGRHPGIEAGLGLTREELEVILQVVQGRRGGQRSVARHDDVGGEGQDAVAGGDPVGDRTGPHDRVPAVEEDVAGEDDAILGEVGDDITRRVRRAHLEKGHRPVAHREVELSLEGRSGQDQGTLLEGERSEDARGRNAPAGPSVGAARIIAAIAAGGSVPISSAQRAEETISESGRSALPKQWSPLAWVLTTVSICSAGRCGPAHGLEHLGREPEVEEGVDQQRLSPSVTSPAFDQPQPPSG